MPDRFSPGQRVRTRAADVPGHTRLPRYARGRIGVVVEPHGRYPLADAAARGADGPEEAVYTVVFNAEDLFSEGTHAVSVDLWESYLEAVDER